MKALTWQSKRSVSVEEVADPVILEPTDAIIRITSTAICGSDLHLYEVFGPFLNAGDILGHENMGIVEEVGSAISKLSVGDRVVIPFVIACGTCFMCARGLTSQCETTQNRDQESGASLYGYTELYGSVPGGQAERLRVPLADFNAIKVGHELPDDRYLFLSDILPTACRVCSTPTSRRTESSEYSDSGPSDSSSPASASTSATASLRWTRFPNAVRWQSGTGSKPLISLMT
jgi:threonine dehydrogenase-like Zn-dependent dehydrogenase